MNVSIHSPSWKTWSLATGAIAIVFGLLVAALTLQSRTEIRQQILDRDGHVLSAVAGMLQAASNTDSAPANDLEIALQISQLQGVLAARFFNSHGDFIISIPIGVAEGMISAPDHALLSQGRPVSHFDATADLSQIFPPSPQLTFTERVPLQEIFIPLRDPITGEIASIVQYLVDGEPVQAEFAALDRTLLFQAGTALALSLAGLILLAAFAFARLQRSHQALADQTVRLLQANRQLSLAAKTSALGAITAHLIHGIRNSLAAVDLFFQLRKHNPSTVSPQEWDELAEATDHIQTLVDDVVEVLREQDTTSSFQLSLAELETVLQEKLTPKAAADEVRFETHRSGEGELPGHAANIVLLILTNLFDNALSLAPQGSTIRGQITREPTRIIFTIGDEGPGIPQEVQHHLFTPGRSGRPGGSGLGLAISQRLAANLDATLQLVSSGERGTVFSLTYPIQDGTEHEHETEAGLLAPSHAE